MAVQIAKLKGARVAAIVSGDKKARIATDLGAERAINYRTEDVGAVVRDWTGKDGADIVFDTVGGDVFLSSLDLVAPHGMLLNCAGFPWPIVAPAGVWMRGLRIGFENMGVPQIMADHGPRSAQCDLLEEAARAFDNGDLCVRLHKVYPLEQAGQAQQDMEDGNVVVRVALTVP